MHYNSSIGGVRNTLDMIEMLQTVEWNDQDMSPIEFIEKMDTLITMCINQGHAIGDKQRVAYIVKAMQHTRRPEYRKDLEEAERHEHTLPWLINRLSKTSSQITMKHILKSNNGRKQPELHENPWKAQKRFESAHNANAHNANAYTVTHKPPLSHYQYDPDSEEYHGVSYNADLTCDKCGRKGHLINDCWRDVICGKCGKVGHITDVCRQGKKPTGGAPDAKRVKFERQVQR
jgi:hypothetical protein